MRKQIPDYSITENREGLLNPELMLLKYAKVDLMKIQGYPENEIHDALHACLVTDLIIWLINQNDVDTQLIQAVLQEKGR